MGQHKTILWTEQYFYWPNLKQDMRQYVKACVICQQFKTRSLQQLWKEHPPVNHPKERICIDVMDMGGNVMGNRCVLTIIDHFSRFVNFYPPSSRTQEGVLKILDTFTDNYGTAKTLLIDNASVLFGNYEGVVQEEWYQTNIFHPVPPTGKFRTGEDAQDHEINLN